LVKETPRRTQADLGASLSMPSPVRYMIRTWSTNRSDRYRGGLSRPAPCRLRTGARVPHRGGNEW